jgi:5-methyltetrahydrofolate--homocysteine methyltransferase
MKSILERLAGGEILVSDGAMGTFLQDKGLAPGECPESWCVTHPGDVRDIAAAYVGAGSDVVLTNSFGGSRFKLREYGFEDKVAEFNRAAVRLAREAAYGKAYVAASVGPTGLIVESEGGSTSEKELYEAFRQQIIALVEGGADVICVETMLSVAEAVQAVRAAKENTNLPIACTFTFEPGARGFRTMMGATPASASEAALEAGADIIGSNCGNGIEGMIEVTREIRAALPNAPILIHSNAGVPCLEGSMTVFKDTPEDMAGQVKDMVDAGANIIGGCCGTNPEHIRAMVAAVRAIRG